MGSKHVNSEGEISSLEERLVEVLHLYNQELAVEMGGNRLEVHSSTYQNFVERGRLIEELLSVLEDGEELV